MTGDSTKSDQKDDEDMQPSSVTPQQEEVGTAPTGDLPLAGQVCGSWFLAAGTDIAS